MAMNLGNTLESELAEHRARYVYTYPFKGAYRPLDSPLEALEDWRNSAGSLNVYVHVPFCEMKCGFCHLFTTTKHSRDSVDAYSKAVCSEIERVSETGRLSSYAVDSVYFGGGTPTVMSPKAIDRIIRSLTKQLRHERGCEFAIESAPGGTKRQDLLQLRNLGFRRISFGVQSFLDAELKAMQRNHTAAEAQMSIEDAHDVGFENVNIDLIYGLIGQTIDTWQASLSMAVSKSPQTITIYPLAIRRKTAFGKMQRTDANQFPAPEERRKSYELAREFLLSAGYRQLTMVAFAREGGGNLHEQNEFSGVPTVGFGAGALSYGPTYHYTSGHYHDNLPNTVVISEYEQTVKKYELPIRAGYRLDRDEQMRRHIILRLLSGGLDLGEYLERYGVSPDQVYGNLLHSLRDNNLIDIDGRKMTLTPEGLRNSSFVADFLASEKVKIAAANYG